MPKSQMPEIYIKFCLIRNISVFKGEFDLAISQITEPHVSQHNFITIPVFMTLPLEQVRARHNGKQ